MLADLLARFATARPVAWLTLNVAAPLDRQVLRWTAGRRSLTGAQTMLLVTRGARTGRARYASLPALWRKGEIVLIGTNGGRKNHPAWYHNIVAHPEVEVVHAGERRSFEGRVVEGDERQRCWAWALEQWPGFAAYEERVTRRVPVVALRPLPERF